MRKALQRLNPDHLLTVLGVTSVVWGLWYANPIMRDFLDARVIYFEPPLIVALFSLVLGILSILPIIRKRMRRLLGVSHIIFWCYLTIFLLLTLPGSSIIPLSAMMTVLSSLVYVLQENYVR